MNIENKKQIAIILLAVGLGLVAAILTGNHIETSIQKETSKISKEFENKKMKPLMRELQAMQQEMKKLANRQATVVERGVHGSKKAAPPRPVSSLALRTPAGKRAYTVMIDSLSAVGGLVNPGDYIDVIAHMDIPQEKDRTKNRVSSMIFQNIQILAVGTNLQSPGGYEQQQKARALNLTFALTPEEASLMAFVEKNGKMQLVLRAPSETETEIIQAATWETLADYLFEKQGTELTVPRERAMLEPIFMPSGQTNEVKPLIQIFDGGREL
ncbi:MAG: Flp pilus assembly protein CpaB [Candidatus Omnitrophica bacterium]|nr:Flp pilus assembly protein CpaB [Candidatus Omnitrophota bacterium]